MEICKKEKKNVPLPTNAFPNFFFFFYLELNFISFRGINILKKEKQSNIVVVEAINYRILLNIRIFYTKSSHHSIPYARFRINLSTLLKRK